MFTSEVYKIEYNTKINEQKITAGELVHKSQYFCSWQVYTNWYWDQHPEQHIITVPIYTILHPRLEVNSITYFNAIHKRSCNRTQAKIHIKTAYMFD